MCESYRRSGLVSVSLMEGLSSMLAPLPDWQYRRMGIGEICSGAVLQLGAAPWPPVSVKEFSRKAQHWISGGISQTQSPLTSSPLSTSQRIKDLSLDPDTRWRPSRDHATAVTASECPLYDLATPFVTKSHTIMGPSAVPAMRNQG